MLRWRRGILIVGILAALSICLVATWWAGRNTNTSPQNTPAPTATTPVSISIPVYPNATQAATFFPEAVLHVPNGETATVTRIIDGDTIEVRLQGQLYRVRYIGMNTPERYEVCFAEATAANAVLLEGMSVTLVKDVSEVDRYDRLLRYVFVDDLFVNAALVAEGYAEVSTYPPDTTYVDYFERLDAQAKGAGLGCHPSGVFDDGSEAVQTPPPTPPVPTMTPATQVAPEEFTCDCSKHCSAMSSCEEAYFQLNVCGCGLRDGDGDGVPCESICPGG